MGKTITKLALDSNIFIYHFEKHRIYHHYTLPLFEKLEKESTKISTSRISVIEALSYPSSKSVLEKIEYQFKTLPNLEIYDVNEKVGNISAKIRRKGGIRLPDAIQLATAIHAKADIFITNDRGLKKFKGIKVILLKEVNL